MNCDKCRIVDRKLRKCSICLLGINIVCNTTCGCGFTMCEYDKQHAEGKVFLTCYAFNERYNHPMLVVVDRKDVKK